MKNCILKISLFLKALAVSFCLALLLNCSGPVEKNTLYLAPTDGWGHIPKGWMTQQRLVRKSSDSDLDSLARHASEPAIRALAYWSLASKQSERCYDILLSALKDTSSFTTAWADLWFDTNVASFFLEESDSLHFSDTQRRIIDSTIVFGSGYDHFYKFQPASRLVGTEGLYERIHELMDGGETYLMPILAEFKDSADIPLIIEALQASQMDDVKVDSYLQTAYYKKIFALNTVMEWQDEIFIPTLEKMRDEELERKNSVIIRNLFSAVMSYDNDWAYEFIFDMFHNRGAKEKEVFSEELFRAFYEGKQSERFKPLIDEYGEEPFDWNWGKSELD
ncbi:MAG: hypothetical protein IKY01_00320 [Prevotella sp.]|nr:hypothetical protein [Prevotella sp.]